MSASKSKNKLRLAVPVHLHMKPSEIFTHFMYLVEEVILEEERRQERIRFYESLWFWLFIIPLFMITTIGFYWMLTPVQPRQQAVVVRLPDDAGIVAVTPARNRWDAPRVVAIYNKPKKTVKRVILVDEKPPKPEAAEKSKPS